MNTGWKCPQCGAVWSPFKDRCENCKVQAAGPMSPVPQAPLTGTHFPLWPQIPTREECGPAPVVPTKTWPDDGWFFGKEE